MKKIVIGRLDNSKQIEVDDDSIISDALDVGGYSQAENEFVQDIDGNEISTDADVVHGKSYFLVQRVKSGC